jgi:hypothetical protein
MPFYQDLEPDTVLGSPLKSVEKIATTTRYLCLFLVLFLIGAAVFAEAQSLLMLGASVTFVGCEADGQIGPLSAPKGKNMVLPISASAARQLAYYKSEQGFGVLAPRGWFCFGVYGSSGYSLYVAPEKITSANLFSNTWSGFAGPVVELVGESGDTSGRFGVALAIARVFPAHKAFVENVVKAQLAQRTDFTFGPYSTDKLIHRSNEVVEYQTPANTEGLGTSQRLKKNTSPISGVAMLLGQAPDLVQVSVRLPSNLADLATPIIQQGERDAMSSGIYP